MVNNIMNYYTDFDLGLGVASTRNIGIGDLICFFEGSVITLTPEEHQIRQDLDQNRYND